MDATNKQFIHILSAAIRGHKVQVDSIKEFNLEAIYNKAIAHNVESLIFSAMDFNQISIDENSKEIIDKFKKTTFLSSIYQIKNIKQMEKVLLEFNKENIPVMVLKGLAVRDFYPNAEHRTMGDSDLLIKEEDLDKVGIMLTKLNYIRGEATYHHLSFGHNGYSDIEIHWTIKKPMNVNVSEGLAKEIWGNIKPISIGNASVLSLKYEYLLLHLIMHICSHIKNGGVGIRQLCDVVLLIREKQEEINWNVFMDKINEYKLEKFTQIIFLICNKLLNAQIECNFKINGGINEEYLNEIILDILNGGVFGTQTPDEVARDKFTFYSGYEKVNKLKYLLKYIFPSIGNMGFHYRYVNKYKLLLPIGWVHRWIRIMVKWNTELFNVVKNINNVMDDANKKGELIKWLEI